MPRVTLDERGTGLRLGEADGRRRRILIISPGPGTSGYYPADVLERDGPQTIRAGTHMYVDHPGRAEERDRPERSIRDLAAILETDAVWDPQGSDGPGLYAEARIVPAMAPLIDQLAEHIGVSIRGYGEADDDGTITRLTAVESVDFVTRAGRGGRVLEILESAGARHDEDDCLACQVGEGLRDSHESIVADLHDRPIQVDDLLGIVLEVDGGDLARVVWDPTTDQLREARQSLVEARNVGQWFESLIHLDFTRRADEMAAEGRLTRDERIALSSAIGDALDAFTRSIEDAAPHLYDRDPYTDPETPTRTQEATVPTIEELQAQVADLEGRLSTVESERDEARTELQRRQDADRVREANDAITAAVAAVEIPDDLTEVAESIRERATRQVTVTRDDQGQIVTAALEEAARTAIEAEVTYLTGIRGAKVTGLGEGTTPTPKGDDELREANAARASKLLVG